MATPLGVGERANIWDWLRFKMRIDTSKVTSRQSLIQQVRRKYGLKKYERAVGKQKSVLGLLKKSNFWSRSKKEKMDFLPSRKYGRGKGWRESELEILYALKKRGLKGKHLVNEFNSRVTPNRSYSSIMVKSSRLK